MTDKIFKTIVVFLCLALFWGLFQSLKWEYVSVTGYGVIWINKVTGDVQKLVKGTGWVNFEDGVAE